MPEIEFEILSYRNLAHYFASIIVASGNIALLRVDEDNNALVLIINAANLIRISWHATQIVVAHDNDIDNEDNPRTLLYSFAFTEQTPDTAETVHEHTVAFLKTVERACNGA